MSNYAGAVDAIRTRLEQNWLTTRISYQNETPVAPWPPKDADGLPTAWVNLEVVNLGSEMRGAGAPGNQVWEYSGFIYAHVFVPTGSGNADANAMAVAIGEIFRAQVFYKEPNGSYVRTWAPRVDGGGSSDDDGNWFRVTMSCPFEYYHRG